MRIITNRQYDAICEIVSDLQKENEDLKSKLEKKEEALTYVNNKLFERNRQYSELTKRLYDRGICLVLDFPNTSASEAEDFNKILGL